jgi:hypothetical protein
VGAHAAAISSPRLASLGSGSDRPLPGLFKSSSGTLGIWDGQHEAHFARRGPIGVQLFRRCSNGGADVLLRRQVANEPMACAGPSVRVGATCGTPTACFMNGNCATLVTRSERAAKLGGHFERSDENSAPQVSHHDISSRRRNGGNQHASGESGQSGG